MSGFKLLAIVPLYQCHNKFRKNLQIGEAYQFYTDYEIILDEGNNKINSVKKIVQSEYAELYTLKNGISINISAVVGLNGSGKSTLIELFYLFLYKLCLKEKHNNEPVLTKNSIHLTQHWKKVSKDIEALTQAEDKLEKAIYLLNKYQLKIQDYGEVNLLSIEKKVGNLLRKKAEHLYRQKETDKKLERLISEKLNVAVVFENENGLFSAEFSGREFRYRCHQKDSEEETFFCLKDLFYSISLNFSHHSLNSTTLGNWINNLFHKNDAYTAPVVINPMRNEGNFDINRELYLSNERLMSNIAFNVAQNKEFKLLGKYKVTKFIYRTKRSIKLIRKEGVVSQYDGQLKPFLFSYTKEEFDKLNAVKILKSQLSISQFDSFSPFLDYAIGYLEEKINKLKDQYYQIFVDKAGKFSSEYFEKYLQEDKSHITKKIRQTINFIKNTYKRESTPWETPTSYLSNHLSITEFKNWLQLCDKDYTKLTPLELMDFAQPGFFNIDFELQSLSGEKLYLSQLSSGEQQMIFNINSIVYHLHNLQSIHPKLDSNFSDNRVKYKDINIILDEIELYYHPDMQRELVSNLLSSFELIKNYGEAGIESINICLLTHSPFILSDIPKSNLLKLTIDKKGKTKIENNVTETFGANIHYLLANDFFLKNGFMGEFAKEKIEGIIKGLTILINEKEISEIKERYKSESIPDYVELKKNHLQEEINFLRQEKKAIESEKEITGISELIGEPILKTKIKKMINLAFES